MNQSVWVDPKDCRTCIYCRTEGCCFGCKHFAVVDGINTCLIYHERDKQENADLTACLKFPLEVDDENFQCPYKRKTPLLEPLQDDRSDLLSPDPSNP